MRDNISELYKALQDTYELGSEDDFRDYLNDGDNREALRKELEAEWEVGDSTSFARYLGIEDNDNLNDNLNDNVDVDVDANAKPNGNEDAKPWEAKVAGVPSLYDIADKQREDTPKMPNYRHEVSVDEEGGKISKPVVKWQPDKAERASVEKQMTEMRQNIEQSKEDIDTKNKYIGGLTEKPFDTGMQRIEIGNTESVFQQRNPRVVETDAKYNTETGEFEKGYINEAGEYNNKAMAERDQKQIDRSRYIDMHPDYAGRANRNQVANMDRYIDDNLREAQKESAEIIADYIDNASLGALALMEVPKNPMMGGVDTDGFKLDNIPTEKAQAAAQRIREFEAASRSMRDAKRIIAEADRAVKEDKYDGWLKRHTLDFAGGVARGFGDKFFDIDTWDFGLTDIKDNSSLMLALDKADKGEELTESQRALLDAKAIELATQAYFGSQVGKGYNAGAVTAESIPFMLEMCINPASSAGTTAASKMARYALKRFAKKAVTEGVEELTERGLMRAAINAGKKNLVKRAALGGRIVGDLVAGAGVTATTGSGRVLADTMDRMAGEVKYDENELGLASYAGRENQKEFGEAFAKAFASGTIENYSEMVGEYFSPILGVAGKYIGKGLDKMKLGFINDAIENISASKLAKAVNDFESHAKYSGSIGEFSEEIAGGILNSIFVGDQTLDTNEQTGVFNPDNLIDTYLGVSIFGGVMSGVKTLGYRTPKYRAKQNMVEQDKIGSAMFGNQDKWGQIRNTIAVGSEEDIAAVLQEVKNDDSLTQEQKMQAFKYASYAMNYKGVLMAEQKRREEQPREHTDFETSFDNGYSLEGQEMNDAMNMYDMQREKAVQVLGEDKVAELDANPVDAMAGVDTEEQLQVATDYVNAKATFDGMGQKVLDDINAQIAESTKNLNELTSKTDGKIHPVTLKGERKAHIVDGNLAVTDNGEIDSANSDLSILVRDDETGKIEFVSPSDIVTSDGAIDAEEEKANVAQAIRDAVTQQADAQMNGILSFNVGDEYDVLDDKGNAHTIAVVDNGQEGQVLVSVDGENVARMMPRDEVQKMANNANLARLAEHEAKKEAKKQMENGETSGEADNNNVGAHEPLAATPDAMPMIKNSEDPDFLATTPERGHRYLYDEAGIPKAAADNMVTAHINAAEKEVKKQSDALAKLDANPGTSISAYKAKQADIKGKLDAAQAAYDYWNGVKTEQVKRDEAERQAAFAAQTADASGRQNELAAQKTPKEKIDAAKQMYGEYFDSDFTVPYDAMELVAMNMPNEKISWEGREGVRGLQQELGSNFKRGVGRDKGTNAFNIYLAKKGEGISTDEAIHSIYESAENTLPNGEHRWDVEEIRSAFIDMFMSAEKPSDIRDYVLNNRIRQAEQMRAAEDEAAEMARLDDEIMQRTGMEREEYAAWIAELEARADAQAAYENEVYNETNTSNDRETEGSIGEEGSGQVQGQEGDTTGVEEDGAAGVAEGGRNEGTQGDTTERQEGDLAQAEVTARLSSEVNEFDKPFVLASNGTTTFGEVSKDSGLTEAPIKLSLGENRIDEEGGNHGYGLLHIEAGHGEQIRAAGFNSVEEFVETVAKNYDTIREGGIVANNQTYLLEISDEHNNTLFIQLSRDGKYWNVNSAGIFKKKYSRRKQEVYTRPALEPGTNTDSRGVDSGLSDGVTAPAGNSPETSSSKGTENSETDKENEQKFNKGERFLLASGAVITIEDVDDKGERTFTWKSINNDNVHTSKATIDELKVMGARPLESVQESVAKAEEETDTNPTEGQKKAGNYKKGHVKIDGYDVSIEQPKGSVRSGVDANGKKWEQTMNNTYGYIRGTEGVDGDHIDVFLSDNIDDWNGMVYVVDQVNNDGSFDEHKVMYGFNSAEEARAAYLSNYEEGWQGLGTMTGVTKEEFKKWVESSHRKTKPFAEYKSVQKEEGQNESTINGAVDKVEKAKPKETASIKEVVRNYVQAYRNLADDIKNDAALKAWQNARKELEGRLNELSDEELEGLKSQLGGDFANIADFVGDISRRRTQNREVSNAFDEGMKAQKEISGTAKAPKVVLDNFTANDEQRLVLNGVHHDEDGFAVATNGMILIADKRQYDEANKGKTIISHKVGNSAKKGDIVDGRFPNWKMVVKAHSDASTASVTFDGLRKFLAGAGEVMKSRWNTEKENGNTKQSFASWSSEANIAIRMPNGEVCVYKYNILSKFADAAANMGMTDIYYAAGKALMAANENGYVLLMPTNPNILTEEESLSYDAGRRFFYEWNSSSADRLHSKPNEQGKTETEKPQKSATKRSAMASSVVKIDDFGEKIGGARKDLARGRIRDIKGYTTKDLTTLKKGADDILSQANILRLYKDGQMDEQTARGFLAMNNAVKVAIKKYGRTAREIILNKYRDAAVAWEEGRAAEFGITDADVAAYMAGFDITEEKARKDLDYCITETFDMYMLTYQAMNYPAVERKLGQYVIMDYGSMRSGRISLSRPFWVKTSYTSGRGYPFATLEGAMEKLNQLCPEVKPKDTEKKEKGEKAEHGLRVTKEGFGFYVKSRNIPGNIYLSPKFTSEKQAQAYMEENLEQLKAREQRLVDALMGSNIGMAEREGVDYRNGKDVTPQDFLDEFGFRGVEFGNWVPQGERQMYLNKTYDAIKDFCAIVGISPKAFSLGGRLGLAFGARGSGRALAHYEPGKEAINLTRMSGVGSLAHEWFHALDNILAKQETGNTSDMATMRYDVVREEVSAVLKEMYRVMKAMDYDMRSRRAGEYWGRTEEEFARLFENYIYNKLAEKEVTSPILVRKDILFDDAEEVSKNRWPYPSVAENATMAPLFDKLFSTIQEKTDEKGNVVLFQKLDGSTLSKEADATEMMMRDALIETMEGAGIEVVTDVAIGQQVLDENANATREMRVYHGSGADFDAFDHSHMGEGEGAQAYGWGTYVTEVEGIGKTYAQSVGQNPIGRRPVLYKGESYDAVNTDGWSDEKKGVYVDLVQGMRVMGKSAEQAKDDLRLMTEVNIRNRERSLANLKVSSNTYQSIAEDKRKQEERLKHINEFNADDFTREGSTPTLYTVEIPEENAAYYIGYNERMREQQEIVEMADNELAAQGWRRQEIGEQIVFTNSEGKRIVFTPNQTGADFYEEFVVALGSKKAASEFLSSVGITGIKYPAEFRSGGRTDGASNYVIFDESNIEITNKARLFRTSNGEVYGYTMGGKIYLDTRIATTETPIHEYSHLWSEALEQANPKAWEQLKNDLVKDTELMDYVKGLYPEIEDENELMHEVFAHFSGKRGRARLEEMRKEETEKANGLLDKARIIAMFHRLKELLGRYWTMARDLFAGSVKGLKKMKAEDFADMAMADLLGGFNPSAAAKNATAKKDAAYMEAVENGDMETAQKMVGEAAKKAMPNTKVVDENGNPLVVFHGTTEDFTVFDQTKARTNMDIQGMFFSPWELDAKGYGENTRGFYLNITNPASFGVGLAALRKFQGQNGAGTKAREYLIEQGYDGVNNDNEEYIAFYPEQIKSADAVTYDDNGNVIPLSERFNKENNDIRYHFVGEQGAAEAVKIHYDALAQKYHGKPYRIVMSIDEMADEDFLKEMGKTEEDLSGLTSEEIRKNTKEQKEYAKTKKIGGGYNPVTRKIIIFAENIPSLKETEDTFFHENLHGILHELYGDNPQSIALRFWDAAEKWSDKKSIIAEAYRDESEHRQKEEFFVYLLSGAMVKGRVDEVLNVLTEEDAERVENILSILGYDRQTEELDRRREKGKVRENNVRGEGNYGQDVQADRHRRTVDVAQGGKLYRPSIANSAKDILDKWENQDGSEEYPYMYNSDLVEMVDSNRELTKDDKVALMVYRYNQLMQEDFEEGRRDFSGGEADDLVENQLIPYLEELAKEGKLYRDSMFREGGVLPTYEESLASSKAAGYTKKQHDAWWNRAHKNMRLRANDIAKKLHLEGIVDIYETSDDLNGVEGITKEDKKSKGWYDPKTGRIAIILGNHASAYDVMMTMLHEGVAHFGLRQLFGKNFETFLWNVYSNATPEVRGEINKLMAKNGWNYETATEEYLAGLAEDIDFDRVMKSGWWWKIKDWFVKMLRDIGLGSYVPEGKIGDNELRYVLWRSYYNLELGGAYGTLLGAAIDVAKQYELGVGKFAPKEEVLGVAESGIGMSLEETNRRFNDELQQQIDGTLPRGHVYNMGMPGEILLSTGIEDVPIYLSASRLNAKSSQYDHDFEISEIKDLVKSINTPIAVFSYGDKSKAQNIIIEVQHEGKNFVVGISIRPSVGGRVLEINSIRNVFPKDNAEWLNWINQGKLLYVDKEKIQTLINQQRTNLAEVDYLDLDSAAKVVENFVNPKISAENVEKNAEKLHRSGDGTPRAMARDTYERLVMSGTQQFREAVQDSMLSLKNLYKSILQAEGKEKHIKDVAGYENAYLAENRMHSASQAQISAWTHDFFTPIVEEVYSLVGDSKSAYEELNDYLMAKHGLERNIVLAERDARKEYDRLVKAGQPADLNSLIKEYREKDYSGLTALTGENNTADAELLAQQMVDDFEASHDTTELWARINAATKSSLEKMFRSGLMSKARYEDIRDMFAYYIPLQGFDEKVAEDMYAYVGSDGTRMYGTPIRSARGRRSKADNPLATIAMNGEAAIRQGNRNEMKQHFLNFVQAHPSDLVSVSDVWLRYNDVTDEWEQYFDAGLKDDDSPEEVERKVRDFNERMEQLAASEPDRYKRGRDAEDIPFRVVSMSNASQHQVIVKRGGKTIVLTINGNPRAAQALNGLTNPDVFTEGVFGKTMNLGQNLNRLLSSLYTTRNPEFVASNYTRDALYSNCMTWVKESPAYAVRFHKNFGMANPAFMAKMFVEWENGELRKKVAQMGNTPKQGSVDYMRKQFYDFMMNGGETGWTSLRDIEAHKKDLEASLKKEGSTSRKAWKALGGILDIANRAVENCARFSAFVTSREMGRSLERSIYDAKEVSVNFNKKGAGDKFLSAKGQTKLGKAGSVIGGLGRGLFVFFNAGVQGMANYMGAAKHNPAKLAGLSSLLFGLGSIIPIVTAIACGGDDDDENSYYNLPEYVRRSNLCFRWRKDMPWIKIPLPIEFRAMYGLGELSCGVLTGKERYTDEELTKQYISQVSQVLPLDFMEGGGGWHAFVPSSVKPGVEAYTNKGWTGLPIYKDNKFKEYYPQWTSAYESADKTIVEATRWLNEATGGSDVSQGMIDWNPARIEYMLKGYLGGYYTMFDRLKKSAETAFGKREFEWRNVPIASRFVQEGDERTEARKAKSEYFDLHDEYKKTKSDMDGFKKIAESGRDDAQEYAERLSDLENSQRYVHFQIMENYKPILDAYNDMIKEAEGGYKEELKAEQDALRRELIELIHAVDDRKDVNIEEQIKGDLDVLSQSEHKEIKNAVGRVVAKQLGGEYRSSTTEYGKAYEKIRNLEDLAEDLQMQIAIGEAEDSDDVQRKRSLEKARRDINTLKKRLGDPDEDDEKTMRDIRKRRRDALKEFGKKSKE